MRRLIASILALSFLLQASASSALAQANFAPSAPSLWASLVDAFHPLVAVAGAYAGSRRNPPPGREMVTPAPVPSFHPQIGVRPATRSGVQLEGPHMFARPLRLDEHPQDPRALFHSRQNIRCSASLRAEPCAAVPFSAQTAPMNTRQTFSAAMATPMPFPSPLPVVPHVATPSPLLFTPSRLSAPKPITAMSGMRQTMSVQPFQYEADTVPGPSTPVFYTGGIESGPVSLTMDSAPTNSAASNQTITYTTPNTAVSFGWVSPSNVPNVTSWPASTYTITLNITQANPAIKITAVRVLRVDSTGDGGGGDEGLALVGGLTGLSQTLANTGKLTFTINGTAQNASASDRVAVKIVVQSTVSGSQSFSYLAGPNSGSGMNVSGSGALAASTTGYNPWWTYYSGELPGQGAYGLNVGNGNLVVKDVDFDTPERGVDLAFQRVYNSQSQHDANNDDTSVPGNYGDGWTSSFDAHIGYHGANTISVYDIDGTRFDYSADGNGNWTPPTGQYASLKWDGGCGYQWFKPDGSVYYFYSPDLNAGTPSRSGLAIVQTQMGSANATSSYGVPALSTAPKPGNMLVLAVGYDHNPADISTSLSGWTFVGESTNSPTFYNTLYIWEKIVPQNGDTGAATITSTSPYEFSSVEYEISGESPSSPYEAFAQNTAQSSASISVASGTPTTANDLPLAFFENRNYTSSGLASGWAEDKVASSTGTRVEAQHGAIDAGSTAQTAQLTWGTAGYPVGAILLIRPAGQSVSCTEPYPQAAAYGGRLYQIWGRNYNNNLTFTYSWAGGDASNSANLAGMTVTHSDGDAVTLTFGTVNGLPELSSLRRVDGKVLNYLYSGNNLSEVDLPGTNGPASAAIPTIKQQYQYSSGHLLSAALSPNYVQSGGTAGDMTNFQYDTSNRISQISDSGVVNFAPNDGTGTNLQAGSTGTQTWTTAKFTYLAGETELSDTYEHYINWFVDSAFRATQVQKASFNPQGSWVSVVIGQSWDSNNNLMSVIDPRGMVGATPDPTYETDYAYDTAGDLVAAAQPATSVNNGTYRPTFVYSYDANHNITAVCDPVQSHALGLDWSGNGQGGNPGTSSSRCPSSTGSAHYTWDTSHASEPYGRISHFYTPNGYHYAVVYNAASEANVDAGLPTAIIGDAISQTLDTATPSRTPQENITYDAVGNVVNINNGIEQGTMSFGYDAMHRRISESDADFVGHYACFNDNGTVLYMESASQHVADGSPAPCSTPLPSSVAPPPSSVSYTYDADGNSTAESHHYGNISGTTMRWYDAGDRLVEVQLPLDSTIFPNTSTPHDLYPKPWMARYLYDNVGGSNWIWADGSGNGVYGDGHLYKVQEYLPSTPVINPGTAPSTQAWTDVRGWAWDPLDVPVHVYEFALGNSPRLSYTYNGGNSSMGQVYQMFYGQGPSSTNPTVTPSYANNGSLSQLSYANDGGLTPAKSYTYDADGRPTTLYSSVLGNEARSYDHDGNLTGVIEPSAYGGYGNISYSYYGDGARQNISISSSALNNGATETLTNGYRIDGLPEIVQPSWTGTGNFTLSYSRAGRLQKETDPDTGQSIATYNSVNQPSGNAIKLVARQLNYDADGRVAEEILPEGYTYGAPAGQPGAFTYDGEDEVTSYQTSNGVCLNQYNQVVTCATATDTITYSARGEILANTGAPNRQSADGVLCTPSSGGCQESFDARNGMVYAANGLTYAYDAYGRNTGVTMNGYTITRAYDADSHVVSQKNLTGYPIPCASGIEMGCDNVSNPGSPTVDVGSGVSYTWGTNGHPAQVASNLYGTGTTTSWEHWDPSTNTVLFESGPFADIAVGRLGVSNGTNGVTVEDRNIFGDVAATHTANAFGAWNAGPATRVNKFGIPAGVTGSNDPNSDPQSAGRMLDAFRPDAFIDQTYGISFQGVRTADVNSGIWMTPDWSTGSEADVMSQQPYMWNNNNGLLYNDPSGFCDHGWMEDANGNTIAAPDDGWCPNQNDPSMDLCVISCFGPSVDEYAPGVGFHIVGGGGMAISCPTGKNDVAVFNFGWADGAAVEGNWAVTAYGDVFWSLGGGAGAGLTPASTSLMEGNVGGVMPGTASRSQINNILSKWSSSASVSAGAGVAEILSSSGQIWLHGAGAPSASIIGGYGWKLPFHLTCSRHGG